MGGKINVSLNGGKGCTVKIKLKKAINTQVPNPMVMNVVLLLDYFQLL